MSNLPVSPIKDSADLTKLFFDTYGEQPIEFNATDVDATVTFFTSVGFDRDAALVTAMTLLRQAKADAVPISQILDTLQGFNNNQLSQLVGEILNNTRTPTSSLGFTVSDILPNQTRQIAA